MPWHGPAGRQIYYEDAGRGDTVLLMPGWAGNIAEFGDLRRELACGFRVVAADLPGSGRSRPQPRSYPPSYYLDDAHTMLGLLDELGVAAAHLAGFSDGGEEALLMAALAPGRALSLVTWGAAGRMAAPPGMLDEVASLLDRPAGPLKALAAYLAEAYGAEGARIMAGSWAQAMREIIDGGGDVSRSRAPLITCPALLIAGSADPFCPPGLVRDMADAIPRGEYLEADGGHDLYYSHRRWLISAVTGWLSAH
jgi:pimeloyl-ACP methyl ester carboxylesterase